MGILTTVLGGGVFSKLFGWVGDYFTARQQTKHEEEVMALELKKAKTQAQIELYKTGLVGDIAWESRAQENSGWKDEFLVIIFSIPLIGGFIPGMEEYILNGFKSFDAMPDWYQGAIGVIVASVFGVRKFTDFMSAKKGLNLSSIDDIKQLVDLKKACSESK